MNSCSLFVGEERSLGSVELEFTQEKEALRSSHSGIIHVFA